MLLEAANISKSFGENLLFSSGSFKVEAGDRIGLIGANGSGKSTIFNIISGEEEADTGGIVRASGVSVGVLRQHACKDSRRTCYEEALSVFSELIETEKELSDLWKKIDETAEDGLIEKAHRLQEDFQEKGGLTFRSRTRAALCGLGFSDAETELTVDRLSGGQRSKIEICKLLLSAPDVMLLDEPTNHLDIDAIEWLDGFIKQSKSAVIIISHDRWFLDKVAKKILSIEHKKLITYPGNYTKYLELKEFREESIKREYENTMREVHRIEGIVEQQRRWNRERNIRTAESKLKQIDRLLDGLTVPESELENMTLSFTAGSLCSENVLSVYDEKCAFGEKLLYSGVTMNLRRGERAVIIGKNGCGKTTLIRSLRDGVGERGVGVKVGYFDQHGATLRDTNTVFGQLREDFPSKSYTELRCALALFLFKGDEVFKEISTLSGGEKARVALCSLMLRKDNFLLLDEPTNHLDLASREILEEALEDFDGTLLAVSHDRWFINRLADRIFYFEGTSLKELHGNYDTYLAMKEAEAQAEAPAKKVMGSGGASYKQQKEEASRRRKLVTQIEKAEADIERLEEEQGRLEAELCAPENLADYEKIGEISEKLEKIKTELAKTVDLWETLSLQMEDNG